MTIQLELPRVTELKPRITVIGVGGAGGNAVNNMITAGLTGVEYIVANTDAQALAMSSAELRIQLGPKLTEGLGAGSKPEIGRAAAEEAIDDIKSQISGSHMVFIAAGMGGGTGTGAASVIARIAKELDILVIAIVTKPFLFEGARRMRMAEAGIAELRRHVDTMIVIPNQNLFRVATERTTFAEAFVLADQVLYSGIACIVDLIVKEGLINLDLADVRTVLAGMGTAVMGTGEASGERRAIRAAEEAISNPLLDDVSLKGARGLLLSIIGGRNLTLYEVDEAASRIRREVDPEANIIVGATFDESLDDRVRISIVASGMEGTAGSASPPIDTTMSERHPVPQPVSEPPQSPPVANAASARPQHSIQPPPLPVPAVSPMPLPAAPHFDPAPSARPHVDGIYPPLLPTPPVREPSQRDADDYARALTVAYEQVPPHASVPAAPVSRLEPRRGEWHTDDGVTIEEQLAPLAVTPSAAPPRSEARERNGADRFTPQAPVEVRRQQRRMPEITEFPEIAQRDYRAKTGAPAGPAAAPLQHGQLPPQDEAAPRRKQGLFERLSSFTRRESDAPSESRIYPQQRSATVDLGRRSGERGSRDPHPQLSTQAPGGSGQNLDFPDFFDRKKRP